VFDNLRVAQEIIDISCSGLPGYFISVHFCMHIYVYVYEVFLGYICGGFRGTEGSHDGSPLHGSHPLHLNGCLRFVHT